MKIENSPGTVDAKGKLNITMKIASWYWLFIKTVTMIIITTKGGVSK